MQYLQGELPRGADILPGLPGGIMSSIVWVAFCGDCDYQLSDSEARAEECPECKFNQDINEEVAE